jgi:hypothetical protein
MKRLGTMMLLQRFLATVSIPTLAQQPAPGQVADPWLAHVSLFRS